MNSKDREWEPVEESLAGIGVSSDQPAQDVQKQGQKSLWRFYNLISAYEFSDPQQAYRLIDEIRHEGLQHYKAPPDTWHNAAMVAGRVRHRDAQLELVEAGLNEWPEDVDLLCDAMSYYQSTHYDPERLEQIWNKLKTMPRQKTAPYWRFWVFGATYYALQHDDPTTGENYLDEGLRSVRRDAVMDILRSYRRIYVDSVPLTSLENDDNVAESQESALGKLERRLQLGIELGVENAYVLANELARAYQERAGCAATWLEDERAQARADKKRQDYLVRALAYLDLAEKLYTGNANHPIWEIYESRIRILMAQRRYGDAFKLLRSVPKWRFRDDPSLSTMLSLAAEMTGEKLNDGGLSLQAISENIDVILSALLSNDGDMLFRIARSNPQVKDALLRVLVRTEQGSD